MIQFFVNEEEKGEEGKGINEGKGKEFTSVRIFNFMPGGRSYFIC